MPLFWSSIDSLNEINKWSMILMTIFGFLAIAFTTIQIITGNRISELKDKEQGDLKNQLKATTDSTHILRNELEIAKDQTKESEQKLREELRITNEKLEQSKNRIMPRKLSVEKKEQFVVALRNIPNGSIEISCPDGDSESCMFANELKAIFESANWQVSEIAQDFFVTKPIGLIVQVRDEKTAPQFTIQLIQILKSVGLKVQLEQNPAQLQPNSLSLIVGENPSVLE